MSIRKSNPDLTLVPASDRALWMRLAGESPEQAHEKVRSWIHRLKSRSGLHLTSVQPAYASVLLKFDLLKTNHAEVADRIREIALEEELHTDDAVSREVVIPVCYEDPFAPDMADVMKHTGLPRDKVIQLHSSAFYRVYFLGFMPGFAYLGGLPAPLFTPRLDSPRLTVPPGSVGIGGQQTGIYPLESPGGWRIIGRTPLALFELERDPFTLLGLGDRVRFQSIPLAEYQSLEVKCAF